MTASTMALKPAGAAVIDRVKRNLVGLKMPRALEVLDVALRGIERGETTAHEAEREGALREKIRYFCRFSLLIVDEIGYCR